ISPIKYSVRTLRADPQKNGAIKQQDFKSIAMKETPITPAALDKLRLWEVDTEYIFRRHADGPQIQASYIKIPTGAIVQVDCYEGPSFPGVSTIEDLKTLLKFLGKEEA